MSDTPPKNGVLEATLKPALEKASALITNIKDLLLVGILIANFYGAYLACTVWYPAALQQSDERHKQAREDYFQAVEVQRQADDKRFSAVVEFLRNDDGRPRQLPGANKTGALP